MASTNPYECPYFNRVARRVLSPYLTARGFQIADSPHGFLVCTRGDLQTVIAYFSDRVTELEPQVNVGTGAGRVPMWFVIPEAAAAREYSLWMFRNEDELAMSLGRIEREVLVPFAEPLWEDRLALARWGEKFDQYARYLNR